MGASGTHAPLVHLAASVHRLPSSQSKFSLVAAPPVHRPVVVLHVPAEWQKSPGQVTLTPGTQEPAWQVSPTVHALLSVQTVLSGFLASVGQAADVPGQDSAA